MSRIDVLVGRLAHGLHERLCQEVGEDVSEVLARLELEEGHLGREQWERVLRDHLGPALLVDEHDQLDLS